MINRRFGGIWVLFLIVGLIGDNSSAKGVVIYSGSEDRTLFHSPDIDQTRRVEVELAGSSEELRFENATRVERFVVTGGPFHEQSYALIIDEAGSPADFQFGEEIDQTRDWAVLTSSSFLLLADYSSEGDSFRGNFFDGQDQYLLIRILLEDDPYYGWLRLSHSMEDEVFTVHDWAWNSEPGEPILAGEIPEPGKVALISGVVAMSGVMFFHRRRRGDRG